MKKLLTILILGHFSFMSQARIFTELKVVNNVWIAEFSHDSSITVNSLSFVLRNVKGEVIDSAKIKQTVIDSINKHSSLFLITADSLQHALSVNQKVYIYELLINNTISEDLSWNYYLSRETESDIYIDSTILHAGNYVAANPFNKDKRWSYMGKGLSSLGKPNKREDAFAFIKGRLYNEKKEVLKNTKFRVTPKIWNPENGDFLTSTDENGYFLLATWPYREHEWYYMDIENYDCVRVALFYPEDTLHAGVNYVDLYDGGIGLGINNLAAATKLQITPSPASTQLQVSYSMPTELHYADCNLQISNAQGQTLQSITLDVTEGTLQVELNKAIGNGLYFCSLVSKGVVYKTVQFMVQR